jgi:Uma2 family endonuclease
MAEPAKRKATYADIEALPEGVRGEIIHGALYTHPRPAPRHNSVASALGVELGAPFQKGRGGPGGWIFIIEQEVKFGENLLVPDVSGWRRERLTTYPKTNWFSVRPDWICEATSPSTAMRDRHLKRDIYAAAGVPYYWIIDPRLRILEVFVLEKNKWFLHGAFTSGNSVSAPPFEAHSFPLEDLWPLSEAEGFSEDSPE